MVTENMYRIVWTDRQNRRHTSFHLGDSEETALGKLRSWHYYDVVQVISAEQVSQEQLDLLLRNQPGE